jgi:hypothetical protein
MGHTELERERERERDIGGIQNNTVIGKPAINGYATRNMDTM